MKKANINMDLGKFVILFSLPAVWEKASDKSSKMGGLGTY